MMGVGAVLTFATIFTLWLKKFNPQKDYSELGLRIRSWWLIVGLLFFVLLLNRTASIIFFALVSFLALKEFYSILPIRQVDRRAIFWAYLSIPIQYYWVAIGWYGMFIIFIPVYAFLLIPMRMITLGQTDGYIRSAGSIHFGLMLNVFGLSHMAYLLVLPELTPNFGGNIGMLLFLVVLTQFNDVAQYVWGKSFGQRKISPQVSPNKTWAGFLGGMFTTACLGTLLGYWITPFALLQAFFAALLIGIFGFFGDLNMSAVKRDLRIKDTSQMIPGHGGILDRLDSLSFTAPIFFHYQYYLLH